MSKKSFAVGTTVMLLKLYKTIVNGRRRKAGCNKVEKKNLGRTNEQKRGRRGEKEVARGRTQRQQGSRHKNDFLVFVRTTPYLLRIEYHSRVKNKISK